MDLVNFILGIVTVVGTLFGAISIYEAKKSKKELERYTYLFELAEKNIDKDLTSEELKRLHAEKKEMDKIIKEEIPKQARITVLYDRLKADEEDLSSSYHRYKKTQKEYEELQQEKIEIPENILEEIEYQILPNYLLKEQTQKYISMLTIISYITAFISVIPIFGIISRYSILATVYPLIRIIGLNMPKSKDERKKYIFNVIYYIIIILYIISNVYFGLFLLQKYYYWGETPNDAIYDIIFLIDILFLVGLIISIAIKIYKNRIKSKHK